MSSPDFRDRLASVMGTAYRLGHELGGGGMSRVFLADEVELGRKVVVKVLPPDMAAGVNQDRFTREIQLAAGLQHPHIVPVHATGSGADLLWYTMPYIEGESLRARLRREGTLSVQETVQVLRDVSDALDYAHRRGVVHRDIKPDNVMCSGRHALVTDFGVAKAVAHSGGSAAVTTVGMTLGTPAYMAPEQAAGDPSVDHRADLYALGAMAYEMLTGEPPFTGPSPQSVMAMHVTRAPERLTNRRPAVPAELESVVMHALEKNPADRWQQAAELLPQLDALLSSGTLTATTRTVLRRTDPLRVAAGFALAAAGILSMAWWTVQLLGLPDWVFQGAVGLMVAGAPLVLYAGRSERRRALARSREHSVSLALPGPVKRLTTLRGALLAGVLAFLALSVGTGAFMLLRARGVGPFATLVTSGALPAGGLVVVADFGNQTRDSLLAGAVTEALRIDLSRSPVIRVMEERDIAQVLRRMERAPGTPLDAQLAREVAERQGGATVVAGEVAALGNGFSLTGRVVAVNDGSTLLAVRETAADADGIIAAVDRLSRKLREGIGESLRSIRAGERLQDVTTRSLGALRIYSVATEMLRQGRNAEGQRFLEEAVRIDSTFAMAWRGLAVVYNNTQQPRTRVMAASARTYALRDRLPERERLLAIANYHMRVTRDPVQAAATLRQLLATWPDDVSALNNLGTMLRALGRHQEAAAAYRTALAVRPVTPVVGNLILTLSDLGAFASADSVVTEGLRRFPTSPNRWQWKGALALARGDYDAALAATDSGARETDPRARRIAHTQRTAVFEARGQLARAAETRAARAALEMSDGAAGTALQVQVERAVTEVALLGQAGDGGRAVDSLLAAHPFETLEPEDRPYLTLAEFYFLTRQPAKGQRQLSEWIAEVPGQRGEAGPEWVRGLALLMEGNPARALPVFRASRGRPFSCSVCALWEIAQAFDAIGQADSALTAYLAVVTTPSRFDNAMRYRRLAPAHFRLGELYAARGDVERARSHYQAGVALWAQADPPLLPRVDEARRRLQTMLQR
jgi:tetratricopeptide (TPR) repeat protein/TolB-like protein